MRKWMAVALSVFVFVAVVPLPLLAQQKKEIKPGVYMETLKPGDNIDAAIARGRKLFNDLGCAGCHPRGGTIGGTAVAVDGTRMPIPIPDLRGAALHYPRIAGPGIVATVGILNDM
ncbi:MAG: c-type cytochrome [Candidatus Rokubacteria bacterium]|nr:c-type cytochrome [Candidatus Rokubacteria bacterium]